MTRGSDVPGRITRLPGGVAMNIAMALARFGLAPALLTAIGRDAEGDELMAACAARGLMTGMIYRSDDLPTDVYMAVEGANGLIAAIADAHSLEAAGAKILAPLSDGRLATPQNPYAGLVALDGNLTLDLLSDIANNPVFAVADLRIAPASPSKAERLLPFVQSGRGMLYVNLEEARILGQSPFKTSRDAAAGLLAKGAARVMVTDGGSDASEGRADGILTLTPPQVLVTRVTGAGDTFMAAHIAAEIQNKPAQAALSDALDAAATYVSGDTPL
jgi:sugar/nucleoside kinase (ribokinase family)